jgi:hypothetical protein
VGYVNSNYLLYKTEPGQRLGYELDDAGFEYQQGQDIFMFFARSRQVVGPTCLINGHQGLLLQGNSGQGVKLYTRLHVVFRLRMSGAIPLLLLYIFVACTGTTSIVHNILNSKRRSQILAFTK